MYIGFHVKYPFLLSHFNETWILSINFRNTPTYPNENLSSGSWVIPRGRTDGWTDMKKLSFAFRNYANVPDHAPSVTKCNWTFNRFYKIKAHRNTVALCNTIGSETGMSGIRARKNGESGLDSQQTHGILLFSEASRTAPGPNMNLIQFVRGLCPRR